MNLESQAQLLEFGFHGFCPNTIALFVEVQSIRHDILGALAIPDSESDRPNQDNERVCHRQNDE